MEWEQDAAKRLGLDWDARLFSTKDSQRESPIKVEVDIRTSDQRGPFAWLRFRVRFFSWLRQVEKQYDIVLLRYTPRDVVQLMYLLSRRRPPVYLVHHTLEVPEIRSTRSRLRSLASLIERLIGPLNLALAQGSICVTNEIRIYEEQRSIRPRPTFVYPNGYSGNASLSADFRTETPELLFVASDFETWQGLDLLLQSAEDTESHFLLHVVGRVSSADLRAFDEDRRFVFHGLLNSQEIGNLASRSWVGISSMALHRKGMSEACPLKVREYLAMGLPVVGSHRDIFPPDFPFFQTADPAIETIISIARNLLRYPRTVVAESAMPYTNKSLLLLRLSQEITALQATSHAHPAS